MTAANSVFAQQPDVAGASNWLIGGCRDAVGIAQAARSQARQDARQPIRFEADKAEVEIAGTNLSKVPCRAAADPSRRVKSADCRLGDRRAFLLRSNRAQPSPGPNSTPTLSRRECAHGRRLAPRPRRPARGWSIQICEANRLACRHRPRYGCAHCRRRGSAARSPNPRSVRPATAVSSPLLSGPLPLTYRIFTFTRCPPAAS